MPILCIIQLVDFNDAYRLGHRSVAAAEAANQDAPFAVTRSEDRPMLSRATVVEGEAKKAAPKKGRCSEKAAKAAAPKAAKVAAPKVAKKTNVGKKM